MLAAQYNFDLNYEQEAAGGGAGAMTTVVVAAFQGQSVSAGTRRLLTTLTTWVTFASLGFASMQRSTLMLAS